MFKKFRFSAVALGVIIILSVGSINSQGLGNTVMADKAEIPQLTKQEFEQELGREKKALAAIEKEKLKQKQAQLEAEAKIKEEQERARVEAEKQKRLTESEKARQEELSRLKERFKTMTLEERLKTYLGEKIGKVGIAYFDLSSGKSILINADKVYTAASTIKVGIAMAVFDKIDSGKLNQSTELVFKESDREGGTGILQYQDLSKPYKVVNLIEYMLRYSDNIATNMLLHHYGYTNFRVYVDQISGVPTPRNGNYITPKGAMNILIKLYRESKNNGNYAQVVEWLKNTSFHDRMDRDLNHSIVAHKIGNYGVNVHDIGIVYTEKPFILAVYTNGVNGANTLIAEISDIVYDWQIEQK